MNGLLTRERSELQTPALHRLNRQMLLASCVGDRDRDALDLDPVDADGLYGLRRRRQRRRIQSDHTSRRSNFGQRPLLSTPLALFSGQRLCGRRGNGGGDRDDGGH